MRRKPEDRFVGGPWPHKTGGWEICYQIEGKKRSEYRKDKREAEARCEYWRQTLSPGTPSGEGEEHPVHYWNRVLRSAADMLHRNPGDKDLTASARALSALAAEGLKVAKYLPPPPQKDEEAGPEVSGLDLDKMTSEELSALLEKN